MNTAGRSIVKAAVLKASGLSNNHQLMNPTVCKDSTWKYFVLKFSKTITDKKTSSLEHKSELFLVSHSPSTSARFFSLLTTYICDKCVCHAQMVCPFTKLFGSKSAKRQNYFNPETFLFCIILQTRRLLVTHHVTVHIFLLCCFGDGRMSGSVFTCVTAGVCRWKSALGSCSSLSVI